MYGDFTCCDCGQTFDEPYVYYETHGFDYGPYERWSVCPYCGGSYCETVICHCCGEPIVGGYVVLDDGIYCMDCADECDEEEI